MKVTPVRKNFGKYKPGEVFDLKDRPAKLLIKVGKLEAYKAAEIPEEVTVKQSLTVEPEISERTGLPKRQYRRRDMTAED